MIRQNLDRWGRPDRRLGERKQCQADAMALLSPRQMLVKLMPLSHSQVAIHINRNGLIKMRELANMRLEIMGHVVFK